MIPNLRIATWNANGLTERKQELEVFLQMEKIDVILISETRFTSRSHFTIKNYNMYTTNHPSGNSHGGTAIIIKSNLKHYPLEEYCTVKIQATTVKIQDHKSEISLSAIYCPPKHSISSDDFKAYFSTLGSRFISGGDWNAKHTFWASRLILPRGRQLYMTTQDLNLDCISHGKPTYWPSDPKKKPDLLDFFISKGIPLDHINIEDRDDLSSDHTPAILNISKEVILVESCKKIYNKDTDWKMYQKLLELNISLQVSLKTADEIEATIEKLNLLIFKAAKESTCIKKNMLPKLHTYPKHIKDKVAERRNLRKVWHNTRYPTDKRAFNKASEELKTLINTMVNDGLQTRLAKLTPTADTNYSLWKVSKKLKQPKSQTPPIKTQLGKWARSDTEKATAFAEHLLTVFQPHSCSEPAHNEDVLKFLESPIQMCPPLKCVSPKEIMHEIRHLKEGKAPGYDQIDATLLKHLPKKGIMLLTAIFNACLRLSYFPSQWKIAQVVMILKPGKPAQETSSYRPISLLPLCGKLLEKILLNRMRQHLEDVIPDHQFGFRQQHGTVEQVHRLADVICRTLENKQYCSAVFLDIGQAFDKVWHEGLLFKIKKLLPHSFFHMIHSYLDKRCYEVKINNETSDPCEIKSGVPQGSILGPVLYLIFTADLPTTDKTSTATYADDTAILSVHEDPIEASHHLQNHLTRVEKWLKLWRIKANQSKSTHLTFTLRRQTCPPVKLYDEPIPQADEAKYLGIHLDRRLTWRKHIWTKRKQLDTKLRELYWLIGPNSKLTPTSKMVVYKTVIKPIWTYGIQLWGAASHSNIEILERFQHKAFRNMFGIPQYIPNRYIHMDLKTKTIKEEIVECSRRYQKRLSEHVNEYAVQLQGRGSLEFARLKRHSIANLTNRFDKV